MQKREDEGAEVLVGGGHSREVHQQGLAQVGEQNRPCGTFSERRRLRQAPCGTRHGSWKARPLREWPTVLKCAVLSGAQAGRHVVPGVM